MTTTERPPFSINLVIARRQAGLTQEQVAQKIFLSTEAYKAYETGRNVPSYEAYFRLCDLFQIRDLRAFMTDAQYFEKQAA